MKKIIMKTGPRKRENKTNLIDNEDKYLVGLLSPVTDSMSAVSIH